MFFVLFSKLKRNRIRKQSDLVILGRPDLYMTFPKPDPVKMRQDPQHWFVPSALEIIQSLTELWFNICDEIEMIK